MPQTSKRIQHAAHSRGLRLREQGLEAGANAYFTKPAFDQKILLDCLQRLI